MAILNSNGHFGSDNQDLALISFKMVIIKPTDMFRVSRSKVSLSIPQAPEN